MTQTETKELAELGAEVLENGIEITLRKGDLTKVLATVVVANIASYTVISGIKFIGNFSANRRLRKLEKAQKD